MGEVRGHQDRKREGRAVKRLTIGVLVGLAVGATGVDATDAGGEKTLTPQQAALSAARDYLAPLTRPDTRRVTVQIAYCRKRGDWHGCRLTVRGTSVCHGVLRVQVDGPMYAAWMPQMRCR